MDGFTIPKKKKKTQDAGGDSSAAKAPPPARSNRKVLPTRVSRTADAKLETPEWEAMTKLITSFHARADCSIFREPVDWKSLGLFEYPQIVKRPMDLSTVKKKLAKGRYDSIFDAAEDVRLVWKNCMTFNPEGTDFHRLAKVLSGKFEERYAKLCAKNGGAPSPTKMGRRKSKKGSQAPEVKTKPVVKKKSWRHPSIDKRDSKVNDRSAKRKRGKYTEDLEESEEDYMSSEEEEKLEKRREKRRIWEEKREKKRKGESTGDEDQVVDNNASKDEEMEEETSEEVPFYEIQSPPPGQLSCLWYSRESFRHVFAVEKVLGWKTRPVVNLVSCEVDTKTAGEDDLKTPPMSSAKEKSYSINFTEGMELKDKAIVDTGNDFRKRREISRINPASSPYIRKIAADQELKRAKKEGLEPKFKVVKSTQEREEVFLIKWRGRSYMHCSWERQRDLEKYDQSAQQGAARGKISRFMQNQAISMGHDWKKVLEDNRKSQSTPHTHHVHNPSGGGTAPGSPIKVKADTNGDADSKELDEEDYFSPLHLEVDRIIGCDENKLDMKVLARQRALNLKAEKEALKRREKEDEEEEKWLKGEHGDEKQSAEKKQESVSEEDVVDDDVEHPWDPEDNVRYIVRWKGLQLTDATWEYWIDIKRDFVDEVDDFWLRQQAPSSKEVDEMTKERHPHPRSFKKLKESPTFGNSSAERPIAKLDDSKDDNEEDETQDKEEGSVLKLRGYQLEGVNWLLWNWYNQRSCILADEMGLGKTIQSIGFLTGLQNLPKCSVRCPFLIVAPLSLVAQWESEIREWAPDLNAIVYHGSADARDFLVKNEFYYTDQFETKATAKDLKKKHITKFQVLITTYEVALKDTSVLSKIHWKALIVDEAHRLKNIKSKLFEDLASVPRDFCVLLTGTPLQNSTEELWALLHFADPKSFASREEFTDKFGQLEDADQVANLHTMLRPFLLRRVKEDVEKSLPPKEETIVEVSLTPIQKQFYKAIYEKNTGFLYKGTSASNAPSLMNVMMELRKCCNHPFLIKGAEDRIIDDAAENERKLLTPGELIYKDVDYAKLTGEQLVKSSGKFVLLSKLLPKLYSGGHKVLIFSQMVRVLDLLQELLQLNHYRYERLDGSTSASARTAAVDRFKRESFKRFVMLLSTRAGGLGLNLTAADTVIIFDSDWNPQNDLQAMARAHRIGQTRSVSVYRLLTAKTYEMHMFHSASLKLGLDRAVLAHQRQASNTEELPSKRKSKAEREEQAKEIDTLLKKGAYDVFNDDDDTEAHTFMDTDIDQLLEKSSKTVTYGEGATSSLSSGLGSFSKASFVASTGEGDGKDVDLDDPDFWSKAVGLEAPPEEIDPTMALIIGDGRKRERKQIETYDPFKEEAEEEERRIEELKLQKQEEKEEKERKKLERWLQKEAEHEEKEKKKQDAHMLKEKMKEKRLLLEKQKKDQKAKELRKRVNKVKVNYDNRKTDRKRALKRKAHEDPVFERVKQAWDISQRTRVVNAILRYGFGRFCKVRSDSNFTSLPIQDVEVFVRAYIYQLGLQAASSVLFDVNCSEALDGEMDDIVQSSLRKVLGPLVGEGKDFDWICKAILTSLCMHMRIKANDAFLRMPLVLAEPAFLYDLRQGVAIRSLHRISFLSRVNSIVEEALDRIINGIGREAMGQRGCLTNDYSTLDVDLKARYVTTEELMYALSTKMSSSLESYKQTCPPWWDRSCDLGLLIGTFFHGLGNYEDMKNDDELPFANKIKSYVKCNSTEAESYRHFEVAANAAKEVFDTALVTMKRKFQEQTHAAVAAVFAATQNAEESGNGKLSHVVKAHEQEMNDDDIVSVPRLKIAAAKAFRKPFGGVSKSGKKKALPNYSLPMPDSKHLDYLLVQIVSNMETNSHLSESTSSSPPKEDHKSEGNDSNKDERGNNEDRDVVSTNREVLRKALPSKLKESERNQLLFAGNLTCADKKPQDDASDYFLSAASQELASIAVGADSKRYQRGPYVPLIVTRFALGAILQADDSIIRNLVHGSSEDSIGNGNGSSPSPQKSDSVALTSVNTPSQLQATTSGEIEDGKLPAQKFPSNQPTWQYIKDDANLRASICTAMITGGYPSVSNDSFVNVSAELRLELNRNPALLPPIPFSCLASPTPMNKCPFFSMEDAFSPLFKNAGVDWSEKKESLDSYLQTILLPHCLKICLTLSEEQTKKALDQGKVDAYMGRRPPHNLSPLPDPFIPREHHSEEALAHAYAILRRARLMKSIRFIVGGGIPLNVLTEFLRGPVLKSQTIGIPVWWCPWIHDLGLLVHAALHGLGTITTVLPLQQSLIEQHVRETFITGTSNKEPALPKCFLDQASKEEVDAWVEMHSKQFPTFHVIEHRLALICSHLTWETYAQYDNVPMFDEYGWPMLEDDTTPGLLADMSTSGSRCLLSDYEAISR